MIRFMTEDDLEQVVLLEKELFPDDSWDYSTYVYELRENPYASLLVYDTDGRIDGYADLWIMYEQAQIANIAVRKSAQRKGIGSLLLQNAIDRTASFQCETMSLEVRCSNEKAISLYEKFGFIKSGIRKKYYSNGENAYLMVKPLGGLYDTDISN